jgi:hypothetical protein
MSNTDIKHFVKIYELYYAKHTITEKELTIIDNLRNGINVSDWDTFQCLVEKVADEIHRIWIDKYQYLCINPKTPAIQEIIDMNYIDQLMEYIAINEQQTSL